MHILPLQDEVSDRKQIFHSFVICARDIYDLFSLPSSEAQLISDSSNENNIDLRETDCSFVKVDQSPYEDRFPGMSCYRFLIAPGSGKSTSKAEHFHIDGFLGSDYISPDCFTVRVSSDLPENEYILQIQYEHHTQTSTGKEQVRYFSSAIRIYTYQEEHGNNAELITAALDFGSEASQIKFGDDTDTLNVREALCDLTGIPKEQEHWQGRPSDDSEKKKLYKSIYHINTKPAPTFFGDLPMNNGTDTFIQTLLSVTHSDFSNLILLPNLKLIELLNYDIQSKDVDFGSDTNTNLIPREKESLGNRELQNAILRQILCNFLAIVMHRKSVRKKKYLCLRFTILIPNVYYQQKVAKIIDGLYEDFDLLIQNHPDKFDSYRGIEVNMISESDASYFGVVQNNHDSATNTDKKGAYILMIDAGKGTTDFSLLHQIGNELSHYESIYRSGIPASGHVLTYAFYEALRDYFQVIKRGAVFESIIRSAYTGTLQTKHLLNFVARLEEQKEHYLEYDQSMDAETTNTANNVNNWDDLIGFLTELNTKRIVIPGLKERVDKKVKQMVNLLESSIEEYAVKRKITFLKVFLSGRAFKFLPFREAVIKSLLQRGLVSSKNQIDYTAKMAKTACMDGGIKEGAYNVNRKSTMLSVPSMQEIGEVGIMRSFFRKIFGRNNVLMANVDFDFFYKGLKKGNVSNVEIDICGRRERKSFAVDEDVYLYFVGDGFLLKSNSRCERIDETSQNYSFGDNEVAILDKLTHESLFPFDLASMGYKTLTANEMKALDAKLRQEKEDEKDILPTFNNTPSPANSHSQTTKIESNNEVDQDENIWK